MQQLASHRRRGLSLGETLLSAVIVAASLAVLCLVSGSLRADTAESRTRDILIALNHALADYHDAHGPVPAEHTHAALDALFKDPATAPRMHDVPVRYDAQRRPAVDDGYGTPLRYRTPAQRAARLGEFISAGPDGRWGDPYADDTDQRRAAADNIHGSELEALSP